jgi:hypothetical protein
MRGSLVALTGLMFVVFSSSACSSFSEPERSGLSEQGLESSEPTIDPGVSVEIPFSEQVHLLRKEGESSGSPWAKVERPEPGVIVFDGTEGHPLLDVADAGASFGNTDDIVAYLVEHFNARKVEEADGRVGFALTVVTVGEVGYAKNVTLESMDFVKVSNPVLALLGGKEGVIHLQDRPPIPVQFSYGANCVLGELHQEMTLPFRQCSAFMPQVLPVPGFSMIFGANSVTSVTPPPTPPNTRVVGGCAAAPGGGVCMPTVVEVPAVSSSVVTAPRLSLVARAKGERSAIEGSSPARAAYETRLDTLVGTYEHFGQVVGSCGRHGIEGMREKFDTISFPAVFGRSAAKLCLRPEW